MPLPIALRGNPYSDTPFTTPDRYTYLLLDGARTPGVCKRSSGGDRSQQVQVMNAPGFMGSFTNFRFQDISKIEYQFWVRTHEAYQQIETWIEELNRNAAKRPPKAYKFVDPWLKSQGIGVVAIESAGPIQQPTPGVLHLYAPVKFIEYKRLQPFGGPVSAKPTTAEEQAVAVKKGEVAMLEKALADKQAAFRAARAAGKN